MYMFTIEIPDWCVIGTWIEWYAPNITGCDWGAEKIVGYGRTGFFHHGSKCPVYHSEFSEYGKTIREYKPEKWWK